MLATKSTPKSGEGMWLWLIKIVSGILIILLLLLHFFVNHTGLISITQNGLLTHEGVVQYYSNPIIPAIEILFLIFVISHSLIGLRSIILDMKPSRSLLKAVNWAFVLLGAVAIVYGIWLVFRILSFLPA
jgi:succinate dehydrogenase / fumarate reductase, membrane anchor subunit